MRDESLAVGLGRLTGFFFIATCFSLLTACGQEFLTIVSAVSPTYGDALSGAGISGEVTVKVTVGRNGSVVETRASGGHSVLRQTAIEAARRWKFEPEGRFQQVELRFIYSLLSQDALATDLTPIFMPPYTIEVRASYPVEGTTIPETEGDNNKLKDSR